MKNVSKYEGPTGPTLISRYSIHIYTLYLVINVGPGALQIFFSISFFFVLLFKFDAAGPKFEIYRSRSAFLPNGVKIQWNFDSFVTMEIRQLL